MRLRQLRDFEKPSIMIIPMIDIMFFLLVFFMMSSLSMVDMHSLGVQLPVAADASEAPSSQYAVTLKTDGTLWLNGNAVDREALMASARARQAEDKSFSVILYADKAVDYGKVMAVLDAFKNVGVTRIGLVADSGAQP